MNKDEIGDAIQGIPKLRLLVVLEYYLGVPWAFITHKYRGSQQFSISKNVEPNKELKAEHIFPQVLSTIDTTLRTLDIRFT